MCLSGIGVTRPNLHLFKYIQAYKPFADPVLPNTKQYKLILTKYQPVSSYTDQEDKCRIGNAHLV